MHGHIKDWLCQRLTAECDEAVQHLQDRHRLLLAEVEQKLGLCEVDTAAAFPLPVAWLAKQGQPSPLSNLPGMVNSGSGAGPRSQSRAESLGSMLRPISDMPPQPPETVSELERLETLQIERLETLHLDREPVDLASSHPTSHLVSHPASHPSSHPAGQPDDLPTEPDLPVERDALSIIADVEEEAALGIFHKHIKPRVSWVRAATAFPKAVGGRTLDTLFTRIGGKNWRDWRSDELYARFQVFVASQYFELSFAGVIVLNACALALQLQYQGLDMGHKLGFPEYHRPAADTWPNAPHYFNGFEKFFAMVFTLELLARIVATPIKFWKSLWSYLDTAIVVLALMTLSGSESVSPTLVRLARFGKLARIVRLMRSNALLESLKLLVAAIQGSVHVLFWSLFVLFMIQSVAGMLLLQLVEPFLNDENQASEIRQEAFAYYGTFWRTTITMFEIIFANWAPSCRVLLDNVSEWFGVFYLIYRCVIGFAVISVVQAVFIQQTMRSAQLDEEFMMQQKLREKAKYARRLKVAFERLDESGDGFITWDEFQPMLERDDMKLMMSTLEVDVKDAAELFRLLDDGDGQISVDEFVNGLQKMKGSARALDMAVLGAVVRRIDGRIEELMFHDRGHRGSAHKMHVHRAMTRALTNVCATQEV